MRVKKLLSNQLVKIDKEEETQSRLTELLSQEFPAEAAQEQKAVVGKAFIADADAAVPEPADATVPERASAEISGTDFVDPTCDHVLEKRADDASTVASESCRPLNHSQSKLPELRKARDGSLYSHDEFVAHYGVQRGEQMWKEAVPEPACEDADAAVPEPADATVPEPVPTCDQALETEKRRWRARGGRSGFQRKYEKDH